MRKLRRRMYVDDDGEALQPGPLEIIDTDPREPEYTGLLTAEGRKLYRYFPQKPDAGFNSPGVEDYDPDSYTYGEETPLGPFMRDDLLPQ